MTHRKLAFRTFLTLMTATFTVLSCTSDASQESGAVERDSAGIAIVENRGALPLNAGGWGIASEPHLVIGTVDGDTTYQLFGVAGAHRTADGSIAVVNAGSFDVRVFAADGTFLRSFGQRGAGPEEFGMPVLAGTQADTLVVVDRAHHRLAFVHPDDGFIRLARVDDEVGGFLNPAGMFPNGQAVFGGAFDMRRIGDLREGMNRAHTFYRSCNPDGSMDADFGDKAGAEFFIGNIDGSGPDSRPALIPFGKVPLATVSQDRFYFASGGTYEIEVYDPSGQLVRVIRLEHEPVPVTQDHVTQYIEGVTADVPDPEQARMMRQHLARLPAPDAFPAMSALAGDQLGYLWVADYAPPGQEESTWNVFDPSGVLAGRVKLPPQVYPLEIGEDYLLGAYRDELGVEYLHLYAVERPR